MADPSSAREDRRVAFLALEELSEAEIAKSLRALEAAGIHAEAIAAALPEGGSTGTPLSPQGRPDRISPDDYSALAIPAPPDRAEAICKNQDVLHLMRSMQAAGKPILYVPPPAPPAETECAEEPPAFSFKKLWAQSWNHWNAIDAPQLGAALAYYTLLSLAPLLVLMVSIAGVFFRRTLIQSGLLWQMQYLMGHVGDSIVKSVLDHAKVSSGIIAGVLSILTLLVGASGVFLELRDSLDKVWGVRPSYGTGLWSLVKERLIAFVMVLGTGLALSVSILVSGVLATPARFFLRFVPASGAVAAALSTVISLLIMTLVFGLIYKFVPDIRIGWGDVWIGAAVTSILFTAGKWLIGLYLVKAGVGSPYAAAGSLIVFLTWVYYSVQIFLLGAEFTHAYALRHGSYSHAGHRLRKFRQVQRPLEK